MIRFKTLGETRVDDIVVTLEALYLATAKPFSAKRIGDAVELSDRQTLIYLPRGMQGCTNPAPTHNPNWTKGWGLVWSMCQHRRWITGRNLLPKPQGVPGDKSRNFRCERIGSRTSESQMLMG